MCHRQSKAYRCSVVLHVKRVLRQSELHGKFVDDLGQVVEGVRELVVQRHRAVAKAGIVGREDVILVPQRGYQHAEHLRAGREAVKQQHGRGVFRPGLAIEDVKVADLHGLVVDLDRLLGRHRAGHAKSPFAGCEQRKGQPGLRRADHDLILRESGMGFGIERDCIAISRLTIC